MVSSYRRLISVVLLALLAMTAAAAGQTSDATDLQQRLKSGDTIVILDVSGSLTRGRVARVTDAAIEIQVMTQGAALNEYRMATAVTGMSIDQIAELHRLDDGRQQMLYRRADSFGTLYERLDEGEIVHVVDRSGEKTVGRVTAVSPSALVLVVRTDNPRDGSGRPRYEWNESRTLSPSLVERIEKPAPIWDGAVKGAIVAALATFFMIQAHCADCSGVAGAYLMTSGIGAGIGLGIDALFPPRRLYRAPRQ